MTRSLEEWGEQTIENTGNLTKMRMETVDEEFLSAVLDSMSEESRHECPYLPSKKTNMKKNV